ncbi:hypothetical protein [Mucilaginibacter kameinonensis]|uniref:hypothetical protein n=1 Tax=Mucilaginibacter kameinonensis TaxID=452286 RepID=UPI000EF7C98E|nr:hypothetical protein [Mucilaginibacter kameinonensis]
MTNNELANIKASGRWPVKFSDFYRHYFFATIPLGCIFVAITMLYNAFEFHNNELKMPGTIGLSIFILFFIFVIKRLYQNQVFEKYQVTDEVLNNLKKVLKSLHFHNVRYYERGYFKCTSGVSWFSWGEEITIIIDDNYLLINSRPNQPITLYEDRKNVKSIIKSLQSIHNNANI